MSLRSDDDRYPFVVKGVFDAFNRDKAVAFGAQDGAVICNSPNWWKTDRSRLQEEQILNAYTLAMRVARAQRGEKP